MGSLRCSGCLRLIGGRSSSSRASSTSITFAHTDSLPSWPSEEPALDQMRLWDSDGGPLDQSSWRSTTILRAATASSERSTPLRECARRRRSESSTPSTFWTPKDPDAFVQRHGIHRFRALVDGASCAIDWRARELIRGVSPSDDVATRRAALARAGEWLGGLPARYALEQEDAVRHVADQCGYSRVAVERAFRARFWRERPERTQRQRLVIER